MSFTVLPQGKVTSQSVSTNFTPARVSAPQAPVAPVEAAPAPVESAPVVEKVAPQLADIAQKAKAQREAQRKWEAEKAAWEAEKTKYIPAEELKKTPIKYLEELGVTYDQLVEHAKASVDPVQSKIMTLEQKLAEYEKRFQSIDEGQTKAAQTQREAAAKQIAFEASKLSDSPELEVYKAFGQEGHDLVTKRIFDYYDETGNLLDVAEAVKAVNAELTEELKTRFGSLSLFKQLTEPKVEAAAPTTQAQQPQTKTLTNAMTPPATRRLTPAEKRERAIRAMRGEKLD